MIKITDTFATVVLHALLEAIHQALRQLYIMIRKLDLAVVTAHEKILGYYVDAYVQESAKND